MATKLLKTHQKKFIYPNPNHLSMGKRGQLTIFIIIGIILLIIAGLYLALNEFVFKSQFQQELQKQKNIPLEAQPIADFFSSCTKKVATDAVSIVAQHGGYITLPRDTIPTSDFSPLPSTLEIFPNSNIRTSVWFREQPNGIHRTTIPSIQFMESEIQGYINENFEQCLENLTTFTDIGFSFTIGGSPKSDVQILDKVVNVKVNLPVQISKADFSVSLENNLAQLDSRLGELHTIATEIVNKENSDFFLENKTIDMMVAYDPEIPFSGSNNNCNPEIWSKREVIQKFKQVLAENVAAFKIKNTNYELQDNKFEYLVFDPLSESHNDININLLYSEDFPTTIEISPSEGGLLKEESITQQSSSPAMAIVSSFYCLSYHRFVYTVKYPVLITITDPTGLSFQFATQVLIDRNEPRQNREIINELPDSSNTVCKYPQKQIIVETYTTSPTGELIPLPNPEIYFKCASASCNLETTKLSENRFSVIAPICYNGILEARKQGYYNARLEGISTNEDIQGVQSIILKSIYEKPIKIYVIDKSTGEIRQPYDSEQITFQFTNKDRKNPYSTMISYPEDKLVSLISGEYTISSFVTGTSTWPITTQDQTVEHCTKTGSFLGLIGGEETCTTTTIPGTEIDTAIKGGVKFDYSFYEEDLGSPSDLVLYTMASPIPSNAEEMAKIYEQIDLNSEDSSFKYPEI